MIGVGRYAHLSREIVGRSQRNDAQRNVVAVEAVHHFVDGTVAAGRGDDVHAAASRVGGEGGRLTRLERRQRLDEMPLVPHPADQMTDVLADRRARRGRSARYAWQACRRIAHITRLCSSARSTELLHGAGRVLDGTLGGGGHSAGAARGRREVRGRPRPRSGRGRGRARTPGRLSSAPSGSSRSSRTMRDIANVPDLARACDSMGFCSISAFRRTRSTPTTRGFTFRPGVRLDMRMGSDVPRDAAALLNDEDEPTLAKIFKDYGDEARGARLAREVVAPPRDTTLRVEQRLRRARFAPCSVRAAARPILPACFRPCASP